MPKVDTFRDFDDESRYEREKHARLMPDQLEVMHPYTFRFRTSILFPEAKCYGKEELVLLYEPVTFEDGYYNVAFVGRHPKSGAIEVRDLKFGREGYALMFNDGSLPDLPDEVEMGYVVGSQDPWDVALAELVAQEGRPQRTRTPVAVQ